MLLLRAAEAKTLPGVAPTEAQVKVVSEAEAYLVRVRKRLTRRRRRVTVETSVWYGPAAHAIVEAARIRKVAGQPPQPVAAAPRVRRRQKAAKAAVRKDTTVLQSLQDPRARWPASKPKFPKG